MLGEIKENCIPCKQQDPKIKASLISLYYMDITLQLDNFRRPHYVDCVNPLQGTSQTQRIPITTYTSSAAAAHKKPNRPST